jgi:hypothetical protein
MRPENALIANEPPRMDMPNILRYCLNPTFTRTPEPSMRKYLIVSLAALALCFFALPASAQNAPAAPATVSPTPNNSAAPTLTPQQQKMKTCAAQYHQQNVPKNQYHSFMSACMSGKPYTASTTPAGTTSNAPATGTTTGTTKQ